MLYANRISEADFESLPPALRRKFFSSYERLLLAKNGSCPIQGSRQDRKLRKVNHSSTRPPDHRTSISLDRWYSFSTSASQKRPRRQRQITKSQTLPPFDPNDVTFYESLPPTLRSKLFSREEQIVLASHKGTVIVDAADEVLYKRGRRRNLSELPLRTARSLAEFEDLDIEEESDCYTPMDHNDFEGFRWLDSPNEELDLTLDDYQTAITQINATAPSTKRKSSFRRNISLSTLPFSHNSSSSTDQSTVSPNMRHSIRSPGQSRPVSTLLESHKHRSHSSLSSIEPGAKYYQDPEARLKLRVYLASPQKFDEAIEFGFPSLQDRQKAQHARSQTSPRITQDSGRTFLTDDTPSLSDGDDDEKDGHDKPDTPQDIEFQRFSKKSSSDRTGITRPQLRIEPYALTSTHDREMTLHLTLTRPDLRSTDGMKTVKKINELPLEHEALPVDDGLHSIWDTLPEDSSVVKKLWRRLKSI